MISSSRSRWSACAPTRLIRLSFSCTDWIGVLKSLSERRCTYQHRCDVYDTFEMPFTWKVQLQCTQTQPFNVQYGLPTSSSINLFFLFLSLCHIEPSLLSQKTLRCGQTISVYISWPRSGVYHIFFSCLGIAANIQICDMALVWYVQ